jgi:hypothetical protein
MPQTISFSQFQNWAISNHLISLPNGPYALALFVEVLASFW